MIKDIAKATIMLRLKHQSKTKQLIFQKHTNMSLRSEEELEKFFEEFRASQMKKKKLHKELMILKNKEYQKEYQKKYRAIRKQYLKDYGMI